MDKPFPAYEGSEPYIFVCYAHEDSNVVYPEIQWLNEQGVNVWYELYYKSSFLCVFCRIFFSFVDHGKGLSD